ncbi:hypothetical protein GGX14DRAFT_557552 [Mycena pura]|uniref:SET domain-containing protein n=1 Tax=Mycena pura TaxID=153505 RepID=A0AAD6YNQ3_9AGAR|nr:hypothetical protein GGX14DRAFT_557552 [Mycena pura]
MSTDQSDLLYLWASMLGGASIPGSIGVHSKRHTHVNDLLASTGLTVDDKEADALRAAWETQLKPTLSNPADQSFELLRAAAELFANSQEAWCAQALGKADGTYPAFKQLLLSYSILFVPSCPVKITIITFENRPQFAIKAAVDIPQDTSLTSLLGLLSSDAASGVQHTHLSEMLAHDGVMRILMGPIRLVNHSHVANTHYHLLGNPRAIILQTIKDVAMGEEITVDYGPGHFDQEHQCRCEQCAGPRDPPPPIAPMVPAPGAAQARQKRKNVEKNRRRDEKRKKRKAEGSHAAA